jgi:hypothetical protein
MDSKFDLDVVGVIEGTDKSSSVQLCWDYLRQYERLFERFREAPINVIEIGVAGGQSLKVWKTYFTRAHIVGIDIAWQCARFAEDRISIEIGSQDDPAFLAQVCARHPPTIVIDDGSHRADHIPYTFERVFPALLPGGLYVIEDLSFHFGDDARRWKGLSEQSPLDYFARIARSTLARSVQDAADWGTARYMLQHVDCIEYFSGAIAVRKRAARGDLSASLAFADEYMRDRTPDASMRDRLVQFILKHSGPLERAEAELKQAIEIGGETPSRVRMYSDIRLQQQRLPEAAELAARAAELAKDPVAWMHAGNAFTNAGDHAAAARAFRQGLALQPAFPVLSLRLSESLERLGSYTEALVAARQGLSKSPTATVEELLRNSVERLRPKAREPG